MKTAVEYLIEQYVNKGIITIEDIEQAEEMEKEQIKRAYNHERPNLLCYEKGTAFKEYYNETFKTN